QTRADCKQYQESDFCLRKPKCTCMKSSTNLKLDSIVLGDITSSFTNTKVDTMNHIFEENRTSSSQMHLNDDFSPNDFSPNEYDDFSSNNLSPNDDFSPNNFYSNDFSPNDFSPNDYQSSINDEPYNNSSSDNQDTDEESIGREYDGNKKHNHYIGHTGPYFPNLTTFLIFLWITKHQIGFEAYKDFANI
ncbi:12826_t:CDS:1, partial [Funneliformis mosseae]